MLDPKAVVVYEPQADGSLTRKPAGAPPPPDDTVPPAGSTPTHGNAWDAAAVGIGGSSAVIDTQGRPHVSIYGNVDAATDLDVEYSEDGVAFYTRDTISLAGAGDFGADYRVGARYVRLTSSAAATITATVAGKA